MDNNLDIAKLSAALEESERLRKIDNKTTADCITQVREMKVAVQQAETRAQVYLKELVEIATLLGIPRASAPELLEKVRKLVNAQAS